MKAKGVILAITALAVAGCTTMGGKTVQLSYEPTLQLAGGSGDIYLTKPKQAANQAPWVVGEMRNNIGEKMGDVVTELPPGDLLFKTYVEELKNVGYNVIVSETMPPNPAKAVEFILLDMELMQQTSILKLDARSVVKASAVVWRDGKQITNANYEATITDATGTNREALLQHTLTEATKDLVKRSVPEMMKLLGDLPKQERLKSPPRPSSPEVPASDELTPPAGLALLKAPEGFYLIWQRSHAGHASAYEVHRAEGTGNYKAIAKVDGETFYYNDMNTHTDESYRYKIRTVVNDKFSTFSDEVTSKSLK